ncbi:MAG TPA: sigma-70 family RNA polymerase sigma factor [Saprospiraceae bacterium]|nr:sigma-70 family RNA polymerase sigma factor [Saprospiraceae bacterium]HMQ84593.1 sigma-70 family RNA polymerase sigma factor [Saprospiraceae bacterium]
MSASPKKHRLEIQQTLLKDCANGDRKAQFQLYKICFPVLMGVCLRYRSEESEASALLNEGFLKVLNHLDRYPPATPFMAWIKRIMINTIIDDFRKHRKVKELVEYRDFSVGQSQDNEVDWNEADLQFDAEQLEALIRQLPPVSQKVFNLYAIDGYSHKEIGTLLGISDGTSKWHLAFARKRLQELLVQKMDTSRVI